MQPVVELFVRGKNLRFLGALAFERTRRLLHNLLVRRIDLDPRIASHFARNCAPVTGCFARFQRNSKRGDGFRQAGGRRIENDSRLAKSLVQTLIREHNAVAR